MTLTKQLKKLDIVKYIQKQGASFGYGLVGDKETPKTVVVEYSSPNIAKPFHAGHLRSTIIGNFIANIYEKFGWKTVRLNYLGDWGTQFGLLAVGFQKYGSEQELQTDPLHHLFQVYVRVNQTVKEESKQGISPIQLQGMDMFRRMEQGDVEALDLWRKFKDISLTEYSKVYKRLGIQFTDYHSESMYESASRDLINRLREEGIIQNQLDGKGCISVNTDDGTQSVTMVKSDGTSLYITRDVAALLDRFDRYKFNKIHYVVENGQHLHFQQLTGIMNKFPDWKNRLNDDIHIKFGRIAGMSSRQGTVIFLKDILNEAQQRMKHSMLTHKTSKDVDNLDETADILGKSAVLVQDLGQRRLKNYKFSWDRVLHAKQDSGIFLQYCHARLCSIETNSTLTIDTSATLEDLLSNQEADNLLEHLGKYEETLEKAFTMLEPYIVVQYLCQLCHLVNAAYRTCHVRNAEEKQAQAYLQMFNVCRVTLANGMKLLGLEPLDKM